MDTAFLQEHEVRPWSNLPVWIPDDPMGYVRIARAVAQGLAFRSLAETTRDTLEWHAARPEEEQAALRAGLEPAREAELLRVWRAGR